MQQQTSDSYDLYHEQHKQSQKEKSEMYKHFARYNLEMAIRDINVDFVDSEEIQTNGATKTVYTAGVSVIVRLVYNGYNSHEQLGYGICNQSDSRGKAVLEAKKLAMENAAERCSRMFGDIHSGHTQLMKIQKQQQQEQQNR